MVKTKRGTDAPSANKRRKHKSAADELLCPITLDLPFDPVIAEDGRVYERCAIEKHFETHTGELKTPVTNQTMGERLVSSPWIKNHIETLIETGVITGELVDNWKEKEEQKKDMEDLLKEAEGGNADAMLLVSQNYREGKEGFKKNEKLAYEWAQKSHASGNVKGMALVGYHLADGVGVEKNKVQGMVFTSLAAERGSNYAAYCLGLAFCKGTDGLSVDTAQAIFWLEKALSDDCLHKSLSESGKTDANEMLQELMNATSEVN